MKKSLSAVYVMMLLSVATNVQATPITNAFGLLTPDTTVTFSEVPLANNTPLTNQFAALGVTFSNLFIDTTLVVFGPPSAENFQDGCVVGTCQPFDIFFSSPVAAAAFQMITNPGTSTFQALLNSGPVESFTAATTIPSSTYYGFQNIVFNQIHVIPGGVNQAAGIDNIEFSLATPSVPEPASSALIAAGAIAMATRRRWQRRQRHNIHGS
jgi:hypothetical protein